MSGDGRECGMTSMSTAGQKLFLNHGVAWAERGTNGGFYAVHVEYKVP